MTKPIRIWKIKNRNHLNPLNRYSEMKSQKKNNKSVLTLTLVKCPDDKHSKLGQRFKYKISWRCLVTCPNIMSHQSYCALQHNNWINTANMWILWRLLLFLTVDTGHEFSLDKRADLQKNRRVWDSVWFRLILSFVHGSVKNKNILYVS